jgi:hypothetical protein
LQVTPQLDGSHAASGVIGPDGGTLKTVGADGTAYMLTIPSGALIASTTITMTPITAMQGLRLSGGLAGGVQMAPDGLGFMLPATLAITPHSAVPQPKALALSGDGDGKNLHLYPQTGDGSAVTLDLYHFSVYGLATGSASDVISLLQHKPSTLRAQVEQLRAAMAQEALYQKYGLGKPLPEGELKSATIGALTAAYVETIKPLLEEATTDDSLAITAISAELGWERTIQLLGLKAYDPQIAEAHALIKKVLENAWQKTSVHCANEHDLSQIQRMGAIAHSMALWDESMAPALAEIEAKIRNCARFKLDMTATVKVVDSNPGAEATMGGTAEIKGLPLTLSSNWQDGQLSGEQPVEYATGYFQGSVVGSRCTDTFDGVKQKDPFTVDPLVLHGLGSETRTGPDGKPLPPTLEMTMNPGRVTEIVQSRCPDGNSEFDFSWYNGAWRYTQKALETGPLQYPMHYLIKNWSILGGEVYATRTLDGSYTESGMTYTLHVEFTLHHDAIVQG